MRISSVNQSNPKSQPNFQAKLEKKFVKDVYRFCQQRVLPIQMEKFEKKISVLGQYGDKNSMFIHKKIYEDNQKIQVMIFQNEKINPKEGVVVHKSKRLGDFVNFIINLSKLDVKKYENILKM